MKTVLEELIEARALIAKGWVQGQMETYADDGYGRPVIAYCMLGALQKAHRSRVAWRAEHGPEYAPCAEALGKVLGGTGFIVAFNDTPGRRLHEVLAVFDRAIAAELRKAEPSPVQKVIQRAQDTDLIQHEEKDDGRRHIRPTSVFQLSKLNSVKINFTDLYSAWNRRKSGSARRESAGVAG